MPSPPPLPRTRRALLALALAALALLPATAAAQPRVRLEVQPGAPAMAGGRTDGPLVRAVGLLSDGEMQEMLTSGFPARLRYRVELWSVGGWANTFEGTTEWDVVVAYDHLDRSWVAARFAGDRRTPLGRFSDFKQVEAAIALPFRAPIAPGARASGEFYYNVVLDVESLSFTDLDELERWLRGELKPAVRGQRNPGTAVTRGVRTLMARLLGGQRRHYEMQSATFRLGG